MIEMLQQSIPDLIAVVQLTKALQDMVWSNPFTAVGEIGIIFKLLHSLAKYLRNRRCFR